MHMCNGHSALFIIAWDFASNILNTEWRRNLGFHLVRANRKTTWWQILTRGGEMASVLAGCIYIFFFSDRISGCVNVFHRNFQTKPKIYTHLPYSCRFGRERDLSTAPALKCLLTGFWSYLKHVFIYGHIIKSAHTQLTIIYMHAHRDFWRWREFSSIQLSSLFGLFICELVRHIAPLVSHFKYYKIWMYRR